MNVLFLVLSSVNQICERGIYSDLIRWFRDQGHHVFMVKPLERRYHQDTSLDKNEGVDLLKVKTLNIRSTNVFEKGLSTITIEFLFKRAINKHFKGVPFDIIIYSTPPITFVGLVKYLKRKNPQAMSYLLLKDIFPQNAVDIGMFSQRSFFYRYFRRKEKELYRVSDFIGCMSPANVEFVLQHNPEIVPSRVEVAPNSIALEERTTNLEQQKFERNEIRKKYGVPEDRPAFIYGGNLGKPQGIPFLIECLNANASRQDCFFVIVGTGTEFPRLKEWYDTVRPSSVKVMSGLPKNEYDGLVSACDVGLIFLDHRFTIPNFPSRLLSYLENKMPVLCATDVNTDIGRIAEANGFGYWCESVNPESFTLLVNNLLASDIPQMGERGFSFLKENYLVEHTYQAIVGHMKEAGE